MHVMLNCRVIAAQRPTLPQRFGTTVVTCMTPVFVAGGKMRVCGNAARYCTSVCNRPAISSQYDN